jgi:hypothetical protein
MRLEARITAYDVMDQIHIAAFVTGSTPPLGERPEPLLRVLATMPGEGQTEPREWLRDTLVALLEEV